MLEKIKKISILAWENVEKAFTRAWEDVWKQKYKGIILVVLAMLIFFNYNLSAALNWTLFLAFLFYGWENRIIAAGALLYLASCPILLSLHKDAIAEAMAVQAYFFLVMTVVLQIVEFQKEQRVKAAKKEKFFSKAWLYLKGIKKERLLELPKMLASVSEKLKAKKFKFKKPNLEYLRFEKPQFKKPRLKFDPESLIFLGLSLVILGKLLLPGYVLTLDMVFVPEMEVVFSGDSFRNFLPINYLIHWVSVLSSAWLVQKFILVMIFSTIGYVAFRFLPVGNNKTARWFAAAVYVANPFVYTRLIAGQWVVLLGYALLPLLIHCLFAFQKRKDAASAWKLFGSLFLLGVFSMHFLTMSLYLLAAWFLFVAVKGLIEKKGLDVLRMSKNIISGGLLFLVLSSYWLVPAFKRQAPLEERFGVEHWAAFAGGGFEDIDPLLNLATLNGFWGERTAWAEAFVFPQEFVSFWRAFLFLALLIVVGIVAGLRSRAQKDKTMIFVAIGFFAFIFSAGIGETVFRGLNLWFFEHMPLWSGFRDSQKFSGFLALSYAVLAGMGLTYLIEFMEKRKFIFKDLIVPLFFLIPFFLGFLMWGGFHGQLKAVRYPDIWFEAKEIIDSSKTRRQTLVLPWHGYMSFKFNDNLVMGNPSRRFFGEGVLSSHSVEVGDVYDQESDQAYRELDRIIKENGDADKIIDYLKERNVRYVIHFQDLAETDNLQYDWLESDRLEKIIKSPELMMYKIEK